jgi:hypothetical protein
VDDIGRAEPARQVELFLGEVDRDDPGGAGQAASLNGVEADPAAPEDGDARPRPDPCRVADRAPLPLLDPFTQRPLRGALMGFRLPAIRPASDGITLDPAGQRGLDLRPFDGDD